MAKIATYGAAAVSLGAFVQAVLGIDGWLGVLVDCGCVALFFGLLWAVFPWLRVIHAAGNRRLSAVQASEKPPITF